MRNLIEKCFVVLAMLYLTQPFARLLHATGADFTNPNQSSVAVFVMNTAVYAVAAFFILLRWRRLLWHLAQIKWILTLVLIAGVSVLWSQAPDFTARRAVALLATTALGLYVGIRYDRTQQLRLLACTTGLVVALTVFFVAFLPEYGISYEGAHFGNWQGIYHQKNMLGRMMVLATIVFAVIPATGIWKSFKWPLVASSAVILFLSGSATGFGVLAVLLLIAPAVRLLRLRGLNAVPLWMIAGFVAAGCAVFVLTNLTSLTSLLGRDSTLTGRTELWSVVLTAIFRRPWLGYGFSGFWLGMQGESASVLLAVRWAVLFAHNGFLDLMLQLGIVGLTVFGVGYLVNLRRAVVCLREDGMRGRVWPLLYLVFMLLFNFTESTILATNNLFWVLYVSTSISLVPFAAPARRKVPLRDCQEVYGLETSPSHLS